MLHQFKPGDRICIASQPPNQVVLLMGEVGVVESVEGNMCHVRTFDLRLGCSTGSGTVPADSLEPYSSDRLDALVSDFEGRLTQLTETALNRAAKWQELVRNTAIAHSVSLQTAHEILSRGKKWTDK